MTQIALNEDYNIGSLSAVKLALKHWMSSANPAVFNTGFGWVDVDFLDEQAQVKESSGIADAGKELSYALTFAVNRLNADMLAVVEPMIGQQGIALYTDNNGVTRLLGTLKNPTTINIATDTGQRFTDPNALVLTVTWVSGRLAAVV